MKRIKTDSLLPIISLNQLNQRLPAGRQVSLPKAIVFTAANITSLAALPVKCYTFR
jgi:hypothetical protein